MQTLTTTEKITVEDFKKMYFIESEDAPYMELMEGQIIQKSSPSLAHQIISGKLFFALETFNRMHSLGQVVTAPIDIVLDRYNCLQPDLVFILNDQKDIITNNGIIGSPALAIEIISPSSAMRDRVHKKKIYERNGVKEYWLVYPEYEEIEIFELKNGLYELFSTATKTEGELQSAILKDLKLDLKEIF